MASIKTIFDSHGSHVKFDKDLARKVTVYKKSFVNKNDDHIQFFGSNLTGVYPVRMTATDEMEWVVDILGLDSAEVKKEVKALPTINENWIRGTDVFTLSCFWMAYRWLASNLGVKEKEQTLVDTIMVLHFRLVSSIMVHYFKYEVNKAIAQAVYDRLSLKFRLKAEGSWYGLLEYRSKDLLGVASIHLKTLQNFSPDEAIQYMITDTQGRMRDVVKNLWAVLDEVRQESKQSVNRSMIDLDGDLAVRDVQSKLGSYKDYLMMVSVEAPAFIKEDLIELICDTMDTMPKTEFIDALKLVVVLRNNKNKDINEMLDLTLVHVFEQFAKDRSLQRSINDLPVLIAHMRSLYTSPRSKGDVLKLRSGIEKLLKKYLKIKNHNNASAVRTGVLLYIVLRTFAKDFYSQ